MILTTYSRVTKSLCDEERKNMMKLFNRCLLTALALLMIFSLCACDLLESLNGSSGTKDSSDDSTGSESDSDSTSGDLTPEPEEDSSTGDEIDSGIGGTENGSTENGTAGGTVTATPGGENSAPPIEDTVGSDKTDPVPTPDPEPGTETGSKQEETKVPNPDPKPDDDTTAEEHPGTDPGSDSSSNEDATTAVPDPEPSPNPGTDTETDSGKDTETTEPEPLPDPEPTTMEVIFSYANPMGESGKELVTVESTSMPLAELVDKYISKYMGGMDYATSLNYCKWYVDDTPATAATVIYNGQIVHCEVVSIPSGGGSDVEQTTMEVIFSYANPMGESGKELVTVDAVSMSLAELVDKYISKYMGGMDYATSLNYCKWYVDGTPATAATVIYNGQVVHCEVVSIPSGGGSDVEQERIEIYYTAKNSFAGINESGSVTVPAPSITLEALVNGYLSEFLGMDYTSSLNYCTWTVDGALADADTEITAGQTVYCEIIALPGGNVEVNPDPGSTTVSVNISSDTNELYSDVTMNEESVPLSQFVDQYVYVMLKYTYEESLKLGVWYINGDSANADDVVVPGDKVVFEVALSREDCVHSWSAGFCALCGYTCPHETFTNGVCDLCGSIMNQVEFPDGFAITITLESDAFGSAVVGYPMGTTVGEVLSMTWGVTVEDLIAKSFCVIIGDREITSSDETLYESCTIAVIFRESAEDQPSELVSYVIDYYGKTFDMSEPISLRDFVGNVLGQNYDDSVLNGYWMVDGGSVDESYIFGYSCYVTYEEYPAPVCEHSWQSGYCTLCNMPCPEDHNALGGLICPICNFSTNGGELNHFSVTVYMDGNYYTTLNYSLVFGDYVTLDTVLQGALYESGSILLEKYTVAVDGTETTNLLYEISYNAQVFLTAAPMMTTYNILYENNGGIYMITEPTTVRVFLDCYLSISYDEMVANGYFTVDGLHVDGEYMLMGNYTLAYVETIKLECEHNWDSYTGTCHHCGEACPEDHKALPFGDACSNCEYVINGGQYFILYFTLSEADRQLVEVGNDPEPYCTTNTKMTVADLISECKISMDNAVIEINGTYISSADDATLLYRLLRSYGAHEITIHIRKVDFEVAIYDLYGESSYCGFDTILTFPIYASGIDVAARLEIDPNYYTWLLYTYDESTGEKTVEILPSQVFDSHGGDWDKYTSTAEYCLILMPNEFMVTTVVYDHEYNQIFYNETVFSQPVTVEDVMGMHGYKWDDTVASVFTNHDIPTLGTWISKRCLLEIYLYESVTEEVI